MINRNDNEVLTLLAQRKNPNCPHWNCYVLGYWVCYICNNPITDPEEHGLKHLDENDLSLFR